MRKVGHAMEIAGNGIDLITCSSQGTCSENQPADTSDVKEDKDKHPIFDFIQSGRRACCSEPRLVTVFAKVIGPPTMERQQESMKQAPNDIGNPSTVPQPA